MKKQNLKKFLLLFVILLALAGMICLVSSVIRRNKMQELLQGSQYNCVFLSMFPTETFNKEYFAYYRAEDALILKEVIPNARTLESCLQAVKLSGNDVMTIYLGVDPRKVTAEQILAYQADFPGVSFMIIPTYRRLSDWMKDRHLNDSFNSYLDLTTKLMGKENILVFSFFAQEWLIADDENFVSGTLLTESIAERIYIYSDSLHASDFKSEEVASIFDDFQRLLTNTKQNGYRFPDLSSWDVILMGDSVIGNYTGHDSIPELVKYFSGARTYNCGYGGTTASGPDPTSGVSVLNGYLAGDLSFLPEEIPARTGLEQRLKDETSADGKNVLFAIHYCLNEYIQGKPIDNASDRHDVNTFCGAIRTMIETIRENRPNAKILLIVPNNVTCYHGGTDPMGESGAALSDYVDALIRVAGEYDVPIQDDYHDVIPLEGASRFLDGELHPNEYGRYKIAKELVRVITQNFQ